MGVAGCDRAQPEPARNELDYLDRQSGSSSWQLIGRPPGQQPVDPAAPRHWRELVSADGQRVQLTQRPQRIVSMSLAVDEILVELAPAERIAGITRMATDPRYSSIAERARELDAALVTNSSEQILGLAPDLVFVTSFSTLETVDQLRRSGAPVIQLGGYESLDGIEDNIRVIGFATGEDESAERLITNMHRIIDAAVDSQSDPGRRRWRVLSYTDGTVWAGRTTFDEVMQLIGAINIPSEAGLVGWPRVSVEQILAWQPEVLIAGGLEGEEGRTRKDLLALPGIAATPAGRHGRIVVIPNRLFSTVSHHIAGFAELAAAELARLGTTPPGETSAEPPLSGRPLP